MVKLFQNIQRCHRILAWVVGLQVLVWFTSGLWMSLNPIDQVRARHLVRPAPVLVMPEVIPVQGWQAVRAQAPDAVSLTLAVRGTTPVWLATDAAKTTKVYDLATGKPLPNLTTAEARTLALRAYAGTGTIKTIRLVTTEPGDYRRDLPVWQVQFDDPDHTRLYLSPTTGAIEAVRTQRWRIYDLMWGLHIMDYKTHENFNHPLLVGAVTAALALALSGCVMLALRLHWWAQHGKGQPRSKG